MADIIKVNKYVLWHNLHEISNYISKYEKYWFTNINLSKTQYELLMTLAFFTKYKKRYVIISDLVSFHNRSQVSTSLVIDRMENKGLVQKIKDPSDQRAVRIKITPKGMKLIKESSKPTKELIKKLFSKLTDEELEQFIPLISKLTSSIKPDIDLTNIDEDNITLKQQGEFFNELVASDKTSYNK